MLNVIPQALVDRGFIPTEAYIHPWTCERVFRIEDDCSQMGLSIGVWHSFNHGKPGLIFVQASSADCEATATVATSYDLEQLLPTIDGLIAVFSVAPYTAD